VLRAAALLAGGALAVHELRYLIGYGGHADRALSEQGHAYLAVLSPAVAALLALALAGFWSAVVRARRTGSAEPDRPRLASAWLGSSAALAGIYTVQESLEGALANGHPAGLAGIFGHAGWTALALALAVGLLVALLLRGAAVAIARAAEGARAPRLRPPSVRCPSAPLVAPLDPVARLLAARGPPIPS
jgi:hypothetical protein